MLVITPFLYHHPFPSLHTHNHTLLCSLLSQFLIGRKYNQLHHLEAAALQCSGKAMAPHSSTLAWKIHGQRSLVGCSPWGRKELDTTEWLHFHFSLSCIGEGNGNPLQCSCLENPRDGGAWWAAIYGVAQSRTLLKQLSSSSSSMSQWGKWKQWETLFSWASKSLQNVTATLKLKDACSLEEKLWPT